MPDFVETESNYPRCPECGETPDWNDCEECGGDGPTDCKCEGECGWWECPYCDDAPFLDYTTD